MPGSASDLVPIWTALIGMASGLAIGKLAAGAQIKIKQIDCKQDNKKLLISEIDDRIKHLQGVLESGREYNKVLAASSAEEPGRYYDFIHLSISVLPYLRPEILELFKTSCLPLTKSAADDDQPEIFRLTTNQLIELMMLISGEISHLQNLRFQTIAS